MVELMLSEKLLSVELSTTKLICHKLFLCFGFYGLSSFRRKNLSLLCSSHQNGGSCWVSSLGDKWCISYLDVYLNKYLRSLGLKGDA